MSKTELSPTETSELKSLKAVVTKGEKNFIEVGHALLKIRAKRLYRQEADTFEEFCQTNWGWGAKRAYQICGAVKLWESGGVVENERQARNVLSDTSKPTSKPQPVITKMSTIGRQIAPKADTSERDYSDAYTTKPTNQNGYQEVDSMGFPIPEEVMCYWNRKQEVQDLLTTVSKVRVTLEKAEEKEDILYRGMSFNAALNESDVLYSRIKSAMPFAVCTDCKGLKSDDCKLCGGRGLINEFTWKHQLPEVKKAREKAIANA